MNGKRLTNRSKTITILNIDIFLSDTIMQKEQLIDNLNCRGSRKRLNALTNLCKNDEDDAPARSSDTAQFRSVYTGFSFTPSMCAYKAKQTGVSVAGLVDYASLKGADEFSKALKITGVAGYIGVGINSRVKGMRIALQAIGVPHKNIKALHKNLADARNLKAAHVNRQRELINKKTDNLRFYLPPELLLFKNRTQSAENLYNALATKITDRYKSGDEVVAYLTGELSFDLSEDRKSKLADRANPLYKYDLAETLRAYLGVKDLPEKTMRAEDFVSVCDAAGAISVAVYNAAPLNEFLGACKKIGVKAVCIEPDRENAGVTPAEFYDRAFAEGFLPLSRKVIDRPRKKPIDANPSKDVADKYLESSLAVCGHEIAASISQSDGLFSEKTVSSLPDFAARIKLFSKIATE